MNENLTPIILEYAPKISHGIVREACDLPSSRKRWTYSTLGGRDQNLNSVTAECLYVCYSQLEPSSRSIMSFITTSRDAI